MFVAPGENRIRNGQTVSKKDTRAIIYARDRGVDFDRTEETIISTVPLLRLLREGEIEEEKERKEGERGKVDCEIRATITREEKGGERERGRMSFWS